MAAANRVGQIVACLAMCASVTGGAMAASARGLAVGRAFSYAYNNPQQSVGEGPMGSSIYSSNIYSSANSWNGNRPGRNTTMDSPLGESMRSTYTYAPMAPMTLAPSGSSVTFAPSSGYSYANPVRETISVLAERDQEGFSPGIPPLTSLAPRTAGAHRDAMLRGEAAFRQGNYADAAKSFEAARGVSNDSAECLLSLAQAYFAAGPKQYAQAATDLGKVLDQFSGLMQVRVRPKDFFGSPDEYNKSVAALEAYAKANPKDAGAALLLSYMQYRDGQIDKALATVEAAMAVPPAKDMEASLAALYVGILRSGKVLAADAPPMDKSKDYAWAGIALAMPAGFAPSPLSLPNQVAGGIIDSGQGTDSQRVSLDAYALSDGALTLHAFTDAMMDSIRRSPSVKDMTPEVEAEVPFQTGRALVRLFHFASGDDQTKTFMGWVAFIREPADKKGPRIAYLLGLATTERQADKLLPILAAIAKTIVLSEVTSPSVATIDTRGAMIEDRQYGFSVMLPWGWSGRPTDKGFEMGQTDFARGSCISPKVDVLVQTVPAAQTPKTLIEAAIELKAPKGMTRKVLSQGPAKLAGLEGYQVVGTQSPEDGSTGPSSTLVCRMTCVDHGDGHKLMYALVVNCRDAQANDAEALADKIAAAVQIPKPSQPSPEK